MIQRLQTILDHFQWENGHNSIQQSWITIKNATFDISKKFLGPVHLHPKTNKWDFLRSPIMKKIFVSCFDIGEVLRSPGKWNRNLFRFLPFISTFKQCDFKVPNYQYYQFKSRILPSDQSLHSEFQCYCQSSIFSLT